jgi:hypothetical protein
LSLNHTVPLEINIENIVVTLTNIVPKMAARNLLNGYEAAIWDVLHADSDSDIDCSDDEREQEMVINYNIRVENVSTN